MIKLQKIKRKIFEITPRKKDNTYKVTMGRIMCHEKQQWLEGN